jgi:signal transduction histidine kinase
VKIRADFSKAPDINYPQLYLQSILQNLISNSIKFRNPNKASLIEIETLEKDEGHYLIIKDNGLGMDLGNSKDIIFRLFKRMHTHTEGTGVGLYIVNSLVESHGGTIEVNSEINKGTTFKIYFGYD